MNIAVISKADASGGGASRIAQELTDGLSAAGHQVTHWAAFTRNNAFNRFRKPLYGEWIHGRLYHMARNWRRWLPPDVIPFEWPNLLVQRLPRHFDIVHVHDISGSMSTWSVRWLAKRMPLLWTQHDCAAGTGGCLYPQDCNRFESYCGQCPQQGRWPLDSKKDFSKLKAKLNQRTLRFDRVELAAPSLWMKGFFETLPAYNRTCHLIANGITTEVFHSGDRPSLAPDVPNRAPVVLMGCSSVDDKRKGIHEGICSLRKLANMGVSFSVKLVGLTSRDIRELCIGLNVEFTGYVSDRAALAAHYRSADVLLYPSMADNQPLQVLEAMACGLPVVAYATGGVPELLGDGERGWLAPRGDRDQLAAALLSALRSDSLESFRKKCVAYVESRHTMAHMVQQHIEVYQAVKEQWHAAKRQGR
jgi:glycosyltransferase involved in cell wall biosynthesis